MYRCSLCDSVLFFFSSSFNSIRFYLFRFSRSVVYCLPNVNLCSCDNFRCKSTLCLRCASAACLLCFDSKRTIIKWIMELDDRPSSAFFLHLLLIHFFFTVAYMHFIMARGMPTVPHFTVCALQRDISWHENSQRRWMTDVDTVDNLMVSIHMQNWNFFNFHIKNVWKMSKKCSFFTRPDAAYHFYQMKSLSLTFSYRWNVQRRWMSVIKVFCTTWTKFSSFYSSIKVK